MHALRLNVITHLHTKASNGPASALDRVIQSILTDIFGTIPEGLVWRECFTDGEDLRGILAGERTALPIDILFVTDHMSSRYHRLDRELQQFAAAERRIGLGCEIQTVRFSEKCGGVVTAPEVLLYGDGSDRFINGKPYTGVDDALLARLYAECTLPGTTEPEIESVNTFCRKHRIACALAHPFDCQQLGLDETLEVIAGFTFIEAVNGGFPRRSAEALQEYVAFHNSVIESELSGALLKMAWKPEQQRLLRKISRSHMLVPFGGSDAHLTDFDRVVTRFGTVPGKTAAADFVRAMLECPVAEMLSRKVFEPQGRGISMGGLYRDVLGIVGQNIRTYWHHFRRPTLWTAVLRTLATRGMHELNGRIRRNKNIAALYQQLQVAALQKSANALRRGKELPDETVRPVLLPSRIGSGR